MAKISISYNCGCGFRTTNLAEAVLHSDTAGHSLDVIGSISKDRIADQRMANIGYGSSEALKRT